MKLGKMLSNKQNGIKLKEGIGQKYLEVKFL